MCFCPFDQDGRGGEDERGMQLDDMGFVMVYLLPSEEPADNVAHHVAQQPQVVEDDGEADAADENKTGNPEMQAMVVYQRAAQAVGQGRDAGVAIGRDGMEDGHEDFLPWPRHRAGDALVNQIRADGLQHERYGHDERERAEQVAEVLLVEHILKHQLAAHRRATDERKREKTRERDDADTAHLYEREDDELPLQRERLPHVHHRQPRDADRRGGHEQRIDKRDTVVGDARHQEQARADEYQEQEAEDEQHRGLDTAAQEAEAHLREVDEREDGQKRVKTIGVQQEAKGFGRGDARMEAPQHEAVQPQQKTVRDKEARMPPLAEVHQATQQHSAEKQAEQDGRDAVGPVGRQGRIHKAELIDQVTEATQTAEQQQHPAQEVDTRQPGRTVQLNQVAQMAEEPPQGRGPPHACPSSPNGLRSACMTCHVTSTTICLSSAIKSRTG